MYYKIKKSLIILAIFGLLLQTTLLGNLLKPQKAYATEPVVGVHTGDVIINELMWMGSPTSSADEWIELKNNSNLTFDFSLSPFSIYKNDALMLVINTGTLAPGDYFLISNYNQNNASSILDAAPDLVDTDVSLSNADAQYKLFASADNTGTLLDVADDGSGEPLAGNNTSTADRYSMERNNPPSDGTQADNWHTATSAVNFDLPTTAKGTPKAANSSTENDTGAPVSTITYPVDNGMYNSLGPITGTANDPNSSGVQKVEIKLMRQSDGRFLNGNTWGDFDESTSWLLATGTTNWSYNVDNSYLTSNTNYTVYSRATDNAGNVEGYHGVSFHFDNVAPIGSILINNGASATNGHDWQNLYNANILTGPEVNLTFTNTDDSDYECTSFDYQSQNIIHDGQMRISNNADMSADGLNARSGQWIDYIENYFDAFGEAWKIADSSGLKTVYVQFKDPTGNLSPIYSDLIYYSAYNSGATATPLASGLNTYNQNGVVLDINANSPTTLFSSTYSQNPTGQTSGLSFLDKYYDFGLGNNGAIQFPVMIRIYFTQQDLVNAGITDINQIQGLYYWDAASSTWKLYSDDGQSTTGVVALSDGSGYAGYVWANAYHFTPVGIGADITSPAKPTNFTATAGNGEVSLKWDKVSDASGYYVRYREGTSTDNTGYTTVFLSGANSTSTKVTGLKNNTLYEFGVKSVDSVGNLSDWAVVVASPNAAASTSKDTTVSSTTSKTFKLIPAAQAAEPKAEEKKGETEVTTIGPENGQVESSEDDQSSTRALVTLAILLIALGAGAGGYYGYQWWMTRDKVKPAPKKPAKKERDGRW